MRSAELDQKLGQLHQAAERISANLVELEIDSSRQLLESSTLRGESAERWSAASAELTELWRRHGLLEELLNRADKLRGSRHADELRSLLTGSSIELARSDVRLSERRLLGSLEHTEHCSPDALLQAMSTSFDQVKTVLGRISDVWDGLVPKVDAARRLLQSLQAEAEELGEAGRDGLETMSRKLEVLARGVATDPLSVLPGDVDALRRELRVIQDDLKESAALRRGAEARMLEARALLTALQTTVGEARAVREELLVKISVPQAPAAPERSEGLEDDLAEIAELVRRGAWRDARHALEAWTAQTEALLDEARRARDASRAPIEARNQLRALLEAYQAKAARLGLVEDQRLEEIFALATDKLYTAPTDLGRAGELLRAYQQALSDTRPAAEATP